MTEPSWPEIALLAVAGASGNAGLMMVTGFIPGPPGKAWATGMTLVLLCVQSLLMFVLWPHLRPPPKPQKAAVD